MCSPVPFLDFERLSHVAANPQSMFVRAGQVICQVICYVTRICVANEQ